MFLSVLTSHPYYPQSPVLYGMAPQLEVKFDNFMCLKCGEEKLIRTFLFSYETEQHVHVTSDQANKENSVIYTLKIIIFIIGLNSISGYGGSMYGGYSGMYGGGFGGKHCQGLITVLSKFQPS